MDSQEEFMFEVPIVPLEILKSEPENGCSTVQIESDNTNIINEKEREGIVQTNEEKEEERRNNDLNDNDSSVIEDNCDKSQEEDSYMEEVSNIQENVDGEESSNNNIQENDITSTEELKIELNPILVQEDVDCAIVESSNKHDINSYDYVYKENKLLIELIEKCLAMENSKGMLRIVNRTLITIYLDTDEDFRKSDEFKKILKEQFLKLDATPERKFSHIKEICETLKKHKRVKKKRVNFVTLETKLNEKYARKRKTNTVHTKETKRRNCIPTQDVPISCDSDSDVEIIPNNDIPVAIDLDSDNSRNHLLDNDVVAIDDENDNLNEKNDNNNLTEHSCLLTEDAEIIDNLTEDTAETLNSIDNKNENVNKENRSDLNLTEVSGVTKDPNKDDSFYIYSPHNSVTSNTEVIDIDDENDNPNKENDVIDINSAELTSVATKDANAVENLSPDNTTASNSDIIAIDDESDNSNEKNDNDNVNLTELTPVVFKDGNAVDNLCPDNNNSDVINIDGNDKENNTMNLTKDVNVQNSFNIFMKTLLKPQKTVDEVTKVKIEFLENQIAYYTKLIKGMEEREVLEDNFASPYVISEDYKKQIVRMYKELCSLVGAEAVKRHRVRLYAIEGYPEGPIKCLEEFVNNNIDEHGNPPFPDMLDVMQCVREANDRYHMNWNKKQILEEARALFTFYGRELQKRRKHREWRHLLKYVKEQAPDPADGDPVLEAKLAENDRIGRQREMELLNRYSDMENSNNFNLNVQYYDSGEDCDQQRIPNASSSSSNGHVNSSTDTIQLNTYENGCNGNLNKNLSVFVVPINETLQNAGLNIQMPNSSNGNPMFIVCNTSRQTITENLVSSIVQNVLNMPVPINQNLVTNMVENVPVVNQPEDNLTNESNDAIVNSNAALFDKDTNLANHSNSGFVNTPKDAIPVYCKSLSSPKDAPINPPKDAFSVHTLQDDLTNLVDNTCPIIQFEDDDNTGSFGPTVTHKVKNDKKAVTVCHNVEKPVTNCPKVEKPVTDCPKVNSDTKEEVQSFKDAITFDQPVIDCPKVKKPVIVSLKLEKPVTDCPIVEKPVTEDCPKVNTDTTEEVRSFKDAITFDQPVIDCPKVKKPVIVSPKVEKLVTYCPIVEKPVTEDCPIVEKPVTEDCPKVNSDTKEEVRSFKNAITFDNEIEDESETDIKVKSENEAVPHLLEEISDVRATIFDIEDPFLIVDISDSSDSEDEVFES